MIQKALIVSIATFLGRPSREPGEGPVRPWAAWACMLICILLMFTLQLKVKPWVERPDDPRVKICCGKCLSVRLTLNRLEESGLCCQLFTVIPCSYFIATGDNSSWIAGTLGVFILSSQAVFVVAVILVQYHKMRSKDSLLRKYFRKSLRKIDGRDEDEHETTGNPLGSRSEGLYRDFDTDGSESAVLRPQLDKRVREKLDRLPPVGWQGWDEQTTTLYQNVQAAIEAKAYEVDEAGRHGHSTTLLQDELVRAMAILDHLVDGSLRRNKPIVDGTVIAGPEDDCIEGGRGTVFEVEESTVTVAGEEAGSRRPAVPIAIGPEEDDSDDDWVVGDEPSGSDSESDDDSDSGDSYDEKAEQRRQLRGRLAVSDSEDSRQEESRRLPEEIESDDSWLGSDEDVV